MVEGFHLANPAYQCWSDSHSSPAQISFLPISQWSINCRSRNRIFNADGLSTNRTGSPFGSDIRAITRLFCLADVAIQRLLGNSIRRMGNFVGIIVNPNCLFILLARLCITTEIHPSTTRRGYRWWPTSHSAFGSWIERICLRQCSKNIAQFATIFFHRGADENVSSWCWCVALI